MATHLAGAPLPALDSQPSGPPRLQIRHACKTFGRSTVLRDAHLTLYPGEVHALIGQNGSGKSTLIKLLSGFHRADSGCEIDIDGQSLPIPVNPKDLLERGVAFVHQDLGLIGDRSVVENMRVGQYSIKRFSRRIDWAAERTAAANTLNSFTSRPINPDAIIDSLHPSERATVAIGRAVQSTPAGRGCIILDESTQSLPRDMLGPVYELVRDLARSGTAVLLVSHRLDEVLTVADRVTVIEDGRVKVADVPLAGLTEADLTRLLLGAEADLQRSHTQEHPNRVEATSRTLVTGLRTSRLRDIEFALVPGEITGVTGITDSGFEDIPYALAGTSAQTRGLLVIDGERFNLAKVSSRDLVRAGVSLVPGERAAEGLAMTLPAMENLTLPRVRHRSSRFVLRRRWQLAEFRAAVLKLGIKPADPAITAAALSGGNAQKLLLAKWLTSNPRLLLLHEPTQAVDVGARVDILRALRMQADAGMTIVIASSEPQDLAAVCDRVLITRRPNWPRLARTRYRRSDHRRHLRSLSHVESRRFQHPTRVGTRT